MLVLFSGVVFLKGPVRKSLSAAPFPVFCFPSVSVSCVSEVTSCLWAAVAAIDPPDISREDASDDDDDDTGSGLFCGV